MQITIEHIPTNNFWVMSVKDIETGLNKMKLLKNRESTCNFSFYSKHAGNYVNIPAKIANECVFYLVSESEEEMQQMKEHFE